MSQQTLKELLKPPFYLLENGILIDTTEWALAQINCKPLLKDAKFREWITAALNEKWERDFGEHVWEEKQEYAIYYKCTACGEWQEEKTNYCPHCGQKLDMPERENKNDK